MIRISRLHGIAPRSYKPLIPMKLGFFEGEKTEKPTEKKKRESRGEGQVAKSTEINNAFLFILVFFTIKIFGPGMSEKLLGVMYSDFVLAQDLEVVFSIDFVSKYVAHLFTQSILIVMPIFAVAVLVSVVTNLAQVGWHPTTKPLRPKLSKLSIISGVKRLFSFRQVVNLLTALLKFGVIAAVIYMQVSKSIRLVPTLIHMDMIEAAVFIVNLIVDLGITVGGYYIVVAVADYAYTRFKHSKQLKMSKQEVKDEYKNMEGDPIIKGQIKRRMREVSMRRMMQDVPKADVIITNPTHYAVALRYDRLTGTAPVLLAKGADFLAKRIKEKAAEANIEIIENKYLARTIYENVDIGREIPPELYQAVAEILAYVYKLKENAS